MNRTDADWIDSYNQNYLCLVRESKNMEDSHLYINSGIVDWIVETLTEAKKQYYLEGSDFMSDSLYDRYEEFLKIHNPTHPFLEKVGT